MHPGDTVDINNIRQIPVVPILKAGRSLTTPDSNSSRTQKSESPQQIAGASRFENKNALSHGVLKRGGRLILPQTQIPEKVLKPSEIPKTGFKIQNLTLPDFSTRFENSTNSTKLTNWSRTPKTLQKTNAA